MNHIYRVTRFLAATLGIHSVGVLAFAAVVIVTESCYNDPVVAPVGTTNRGNYDIGVSSSALSLRAGQSVSVAIVTHRIDHFAEPLSLVVLDQPDGLSSTIAGTGTIDSATLTLTARDEIAPGTYDVVVQASAHDAGVRSRVVTLTVLETITEIPQIAQVAAGEHSCALSPTGKAYCWGPNADGQLGNGERADRNALPVTVSGGLAFASLSVSKLNAVTCGLRVGGEAYCWGTNSLGQLGSGSTFGHVTPHAIEGGLRFQDLAVGTSHVCGVTVEHDAYCWGTTANGAFGDGSVGTHETPEPAAEGMKFESIVAGGDFTCALTEAGAAYCWGLGRQGQLGDGRAENSTTPVAVAGEIVFQALVAGQFTVCGLTASGRALCWGNNEFGTVGDGITGLEGGTSRHRVPAAVIGQHHFESLSAGYETMCGVTAEHAAYCWGLNSDGQVGDGTFEHRGFPVRVMGELTFRSVAAGTVTSCGATMSGDVACWGSNQHGGLGNGSAIDASSPVPVAVRWPVAGVP